MWEAEWRKGDSEYQEGWSQTQGSRASTSSSPIDLAQAISHRRVRDESSGSSRTQAIDKVRSRYDESVKAVASMGMNSEVLTVPPPKPNKKSFVAPPSTAEEKFKALKESSSVGTMWWSVGSTAFNAPEMTEPAIARLEERKEEQERKLMKAADDWSSVKAMANDIEQRRTSEGLSYDDLSADDVKLLVSFVFSARKAKGKTEHMKKKDTALSFLATLAPGEMHELLHRTQPGVAAVPTCLGPAVLTDTRNSPRLMLTNTNI